MVRTEVGGYCHAAARLPHHRPRRMIQHARIKKARGAAFRRAPFQHAARPQRHRQVAPRPQAQAPRHTRHHHIPNRPPRAATPAYRQQAPALRAKRHVLARAAHTSAERDLLRARQREGKRPEPAPRVQRHCHGAASRRPPLLAFSVTPAAALSGQPPPAPRTTAPSCSAHFKANGAGTSGREKPDERWQAGTCRQAAPAAAEMTPPSARLQHQRRGAACRSRPNRCFSGPREHRPTTRAYVSKRTTTGSGQQVAPAHARQPAAPA